jgi:multiple antibiotic resistance protein
LESCKELFRNGALKSPPPATRCPQAPLWWFTIEKMPFRSAWISFLLAFTALLPLINPIGSALVFLGLVGDESIPVYKHLARKIAMATIVFLIVIEFLGSLILNFFGISLPVVQLTGGIIIAATAWSLLFEKDAGANARNKKMEIGANGSPEDDGLDGKIFYPFTFPITAGPGTLVVMLTLSAQVSTKSLPATVAGHIGIILAAVVLCGSVYFCYAYAPRLIRAISPSTVHGVLRVIAFILMCIGVQIAWNGISMLGRNLINSR